MEITRNPLCWPNNVPRTAPHLRSTPKFLERSINQSVTSVLQEINRLNKQWHDHRDESVIISSNLRLKLDGLPGGNQPEPHDTGVAIYFKLRFSRNGKWYDRPCVLTCDKWSKVTDNIQAIHRDIEAQRARERWGCTSIEQAFQGYVAIPERCGGSPWWITLKIPSSAQRIDIEDAYKRLCKTHHPDVNGGSEKSFTELKEAYDQAMAQFR